jgi:3-methyladenine DNA glycosylase Mpg
MRDAAAVGMVRQDADADDKRAVRLLAHEERAEMVEERTGSKQRLEAGRRIGIGHGTNPRARYCMRKMNVLN